MKALALDARVILMDEPTGWLAASEVAKLHATVRALKARGVGIVYISHVLDEIFAVCDTMTIMRDGRVVAESAVADIDRPRVVHLMVGEKLARESAKAAHAKRHPRGNGEVRLSARELTKRGVFTRCQLRSPCRRDPLHYRADRLEAHRTGAHPVRRRPLRQRHAGNRRPAACRSPPRPRRWPAGVGFVPEDRHREGLMLDMTMTENLAMATLDRFRSGLLLLSRRRMTEAAQRAIASLSIQPPDGSSDRQAALRRQPAEGAGRQVAEPRPANPHPRRADGRRRRRRQGGNLRHPAPRARTRRGDARRLLRPGGGHDDRRPHRRDGGWAPGSDRTTPTRPICTKSSAKSAERRHEREQRMELARSSEAHLAANALPLAILAIVVVFAHCPACVPNARQPHRHRAPGGADRHHGDLHDLRHHDRRR